MDDVKYLPEVDGHRVAYWEFGNPDGVPVITFHGGPGSQSKYKHTDRYDLDNCRLIMFDQRGCGMSTPLGEIKNNTSQDIVADAERIRIELGIDQWVVAGPSWGATLAVLYAIEYPQNVRGIMVASLYMADQATNDWTFDGDQGVAKLMPDVWAKRMEFFDEFTIDHATHNQDILRLLETGDLAIQQAVTAGLYNWEGNLLSSEWPVNYLAPDDIDEAGIAGATMFVHYLGNQAFLPDRYIMENVEKIKDISAVFVHGRYDIVCPMSGAYELHESMTDSQFVIAQSSGHKLTVEGDAITRQAFDAFIQKIIT